MDNIPHYLILLEQITHNIAKTHPLEVPIGCFIVNHDTKKIIAVGYNQVEKNNDPTSHAEINAIKKACNRLNTKNLHNCTIYCSIEPCLMCMGAILHSNIKNVIYTGENLKSSAFKPNEVLYDINLLKFDNIKNKNLVSTFFLNKR